MGDGLWLHSGLRADELRTLLQTRWEDAEWELICEKTDYLSRELVKADCIILRRSVASNGL